MRREKIPETWTPRRIKRRLVFVCVCVFLVHFAGTASKCWKQKKTFSQQCLSDYRALLFIGQISSETEVFSKQVFLRVNIFNSQCFEGKYLSKELKSQKRYRIKVSMNEVVMCKPLSRNYVKALSKYSQV